MKFSLTEMERPSNIWLIISVTIDKYFLSLLTPTMRFNSSKKWTSGEFKRERIRAWVKESPSLRKLFHRLLKKSMLIFSMRNQVMLCNRLSRISGMSWDPFVLRISSRIRRSPSIKRHHLSRVLPIKIFLVSLDKMARLPDWAGRSS